MNARPPKSSSQGRNSKCGDNAPQFLCGVCLCILCPLMTIWSCIKLPFKAARQCACVCGSAKKPVYASDSTASDIDLGYLSGKPRTSSLRALPREKMAHKDMAMESKTVKEASKQQP